MRSVGCSVRESARERIVEAITVQTEAALPDGLVKWLACRMEQMPLASKTEDAILKLAIYHNLVATYSEAGWYQKAVKLLPEQVRGGDLVQQLGKQVCATCHRRLAVQLAKDKDRAR